MVRFLAFYFLVISHTFALNGGLYPEDGSMQMNKWYYSGGQKGPIIPQNVLLDIESSFKKYEVEAVKVDEYQWIQDILFVDQKGNLVELAKIPNDSDYYDNLTMGVYDLDWSIGTILRFNNRLKYVPLGSQLKYSFLEGGQTITGKFKNGKNYLIMYQSRFESMMGPYSDEMSLDEMKKLVANELKLEPQHLYLLPPHIGSEHLDLFMKAVEGGTILIDDPDLRRSVLDRLSPSDFINSIYAYENDKKIHQFKKSQQRKKLKVITKILEKDFKVIPVAGRFFHIESKNDYKWVSEFVNFFNGVSGNFKGQKFYITNRANGETQLEKAWEHTLSKFGFKSSNIDFPGIYSNGSGLDCMGTPSI